MQLYVDMCLHLSMARVDISVNIMYYYGLKYNWEPSKVFILLSKNQSRNDEVEKFLKTNSESETKNRADKRPIIITTPFRSSLWNIKSQNYLLRTLWLGCVTKSPCLGLYLIKLIDSVISHFLSLKVYILSSVYLALVGSLAIFFNGTILALYLTVRKV